MTVNANVIERVKARANAKARQVTAHQLQVGLPPTAGATRKTNYRGDEGAVSLAQVASWLEYGTDSMPARPFMRQWFDANRDRLQSELKQAVKDEYKGNKDAVAALGAKWVEELREYLLTDAGHLEPLATETIARKAAAGLSAPEIPGVATRQLAEALTSIDGKPGR